MLFWYCKTTYNLRQIFFSKNDIQFRTEEVFYTILDTRNIDFLENGQGYPLGPY